MLYYLHFDTAYKKKKKKNQRFKKDITVTQSSGEMGKTNG